MTTTRSAILSQQDISRRLRRMAIEVAERNVGEDQLIVAGIEGNGMLVAQKLMEALQPLLQVQITLLTIKLNKQAPLDVTLNSDLDFNGKNILVVDDVADTGRTLLYALKPFLQAQPKKIQTLVLVERSHKLFPVTTDFVGLSLSTTLQEHIRVETEGDRITGAWLQ